MQKIYTNYLVAEILYETIALCTFQARILIIGVKVSCKGSIRNQNQQIRFILFFLCFHTLYLWLRQIDNFINSYHQQNQYLFKKLFPWLHLWIFSYLHSLEVLEGFIHENIFLSIAMLSAGNSNVFNNVAMIMRNYLE